MRTEKRVAIDAEGKPLFKPRMTRLHPVAWQDRHASQQKLYEAVTDYVRHGYNQAMAAKQRHIGFLMILMQRLVTSSTAAIRATLEKRQALLDQPQLQPSLFETADVDEWAELDGQTQVDLAIQTKGWEMEKAEVETLLDLARATEAQGTDAKAEALLELIYKLQQEENDPELKVLVFTEFVPTQAMLADFLESRGFSVATLNGSMDLEARTRAQQSFARDIRILISTDAGGEGLNLQFCHVIVNFDMPWNPMRVEQRIGRVDRIGQPHVVRAINFVLEDTVEHRVRGWLVQHYADLPSLPAAKGPVMAHHVPRYLALRRNAGEERVALLVFDGLALDQWFQIRERLTARLPGFSAEEGGCFAWLPTLTSVSRQALFSGLKPREFSNSIETTSQEPSLWARFWQENGLRKPEIVYQKGLKRTEQLAELEDAISRPATKVAGIVVDMVDEIVHGAMLGKRGIAGQINAWCETGFVEKLFLLLAEQGYQIYLTADHGNVDAEGIGRLSQGVVSELRGERVRTYRSETLAASVPSEIDAFRFDSPGLPPDFLPVYAGTRGAFVPKGDQIVAHGGISVEELIVPFIKINIKRPAS